MPPPKKAAKKVAKKAAKKSAGHHHEKKHDAKDLRRAFEHMGRLEILQKSLKSSTADAIDTLTTLAQREIKGENNKDAADLLRASEHLGFAILAGGTTPGGRISAGLEQTITEHFEELRRKADKHWDDHEHHSTALTRIYQSARKSATKAMQDGAYYQALEFARAAEALAHVELNGPERLEAGTKNLQLKSS